jgi:hypothetical protein
VAFEPDIEPAPAIAVGVRAFDGRNAARRKPAVGVQEQQRRAGSHRGAGVHLDRTAARRNQHLIRERQCDVRCTVAASTVDDDDFVSRVAQRSEG